MSYNVSSSTHNSTLSHNTVFPLKDQNKFATTFLSILVLREHVPHTPPPTTVPKKQRVCQSITARIHTHSARNCADMPLHVSELHGQFVTRSGVVSERGQGDLRVTILYS